MKYSTIRFWLSPGVRFLWPTTFIGTENLILDKRAIYTCNHYSLMDSNPMAVKLFVKDFNVVIKEEAFKNKFAAKFLTDIGGIPIKRGDADVDAVKAILKVLKDDKQLLMYPEGTRNKENSKEMLEFKTGAVVFSLKTGAPIIPMIQYRPPKVFRRNFVLIGEPITFEQYKGQKLNIAKELANRELTDVMNKLRVQLDDIVENYKGNLKKYNAANHLLLEKK